MVVGSEWFDVGVLEVIIQVTFPRWVAMLRCRNRKLDSFSSLIDSNSQSILASKPQGGLTSIS